VADVTDFAPTSVPGGVTAARGFSASGVAAGIRNGGAGKDVALIVADRPSAAAGVFTTNKVAAAPVVVSRETLVPGVLQAIVVNAGNANACTGWRGLEDARAMQAATAEALGVFTELVAVASTGVIGVRLPLGLVESGISDAAAELDTNGGASAAEAIMTTDTFAKECAVRVVVGEHTWTVGGMAKGSGMIRPNMATMLGFITTDAPLTATAAEEVLRAAVGRTFNRVTVDGDTSTNDMVLLMANGAAGGESVEVGDPRLEPVAAALETVAAELARMIARDGEGATTFVEVTVTGAASDSDAELAAFTIAESPLVKTAVFGRDPNWGRVAMALGRSGAQVDPDRFEIAVAGVLTCADGQAVDFDETAASAAMDAPGVVIAVDMHVGDGEATVWTCDLSYDYIRINAEYRT
jgi:glutamate N-acetyltransferase/amino-acid N-acetyltransferase